MPKKAAIAIIAAGTVLIITALLLLLYNREENRRAGQESERMLSDIEAAIDLHKEETESPDQEEEEPLSPEMPVVMIDGYEYVGYVEIPEIDLKLPVMSEWDYDRLKIAPCRHFGSSRTDDLVIAGHNYANHFGNLKKLKTGDTVFFTDMDGIVNTYSVERMSIMKPDNKDVVQNSGFDLVLYTCTYNGLTRIVVFCNR